MAHGKLTKKQMITNHLDAGKSITSEESFELYHATRLSGIIFDLIKDGYPIHKESETRGDVTFTRYSKDTFNLNSVMD